MVFRPSGVDATGQLPLPTSLAQVCPARRSSYSAAAIRIAWGFTNTGADVQDIFVERINPDNPNEYLTPTGWQRFETERIEIGVKGAPAHILERRRTRHGPVLPGSYRNLGADARA